MFAPRHSSNTPWITRIDIPVIPSTLVTDRRPCVAFIHANDIKVQMSAVILLTSEHLGNVIPFSCDLVNSILLVWLCLRLCLSLQCSAVSAYPPAAWPTSSLLTIRMYPSLQTYILMRTWSQSTTSIVTLSGKTCNWHPIKLCSDMCLLQKPMPLECDLYLGQCWKKSPPTNTDHKCPAHLIIFTSSGSAKA